VFGTLALFSARPMQRIDPTGPSVYRRIESDEPTMLIDERIDYSNKSNQKLKSIINAGDKKGLGVEALAKSTQFTARKHSH
jgi:hypothetical protein